MNRLKSLLFTKSKFHYLCKIPSISFILPRVEVASSMCNINIYFTNK